MYSHEPISPGGLLIIAVVGTLVLGATLLWFGAWRWFVSWRRRNAWSGLADTHDLSVNHGDRGQFRVSGDVEGIGFETYTEIERIESNSEPSSSRSHRSEPTDSDGVTTRSYVCFEVELPDRLSYSLHLVGQVRGSALAALGDSGGHDIGHEELDARFSLQNHGDEASLELLSHPDVVIALLKLHKFDSDIEIHQRQFHHRTDDWLFSEDDIREHLEPLIDAARQIHETADESRDSRDTTSGS